jgi:hypothetical protein
MWEPQPLTTLRASKACRGENFTFKCERGYVVWCNMAAKWDSATTVAFNCKFENYFLFPKTTAQFVTYSLLLWHLSSWYLLFELKVVYFAIKYEVVQNPFLEITYILLYLHILVLKEVQLWFREYLDVVSIFWTITAFFGSSTHLRVAQSS